MGSIASSGGVSTEPDGGVSAEPDGGVSAGPVGGVSAGPVGGVFAGPVGGVFAGPVGGASGGALGGHDCAISSSIALNAAAGWPPTVSAGLVCLPPAFVFSVPHAPSVTAASAVITRMSRGRRQEGANMLVKAGARFMRTVSDQASPCT
ncbi:hypothetical protein ACIP4U_30465 [Streptomyces caelestis]|uniref:hypothetical protein n=1 Tax=Streptomyces caelestis TaxID=36816 RepID=UPI0037F818FE